MSYGRLSECWQGRARKMELVDENPLEKRMKSYYFKATGTSFLLITLVSVEVCCSGAFSISQGRCNISGVRSGRWRVGFAATGVLPRPGIFSDRGPYNNGQRTYLRDSFLFGPISSTHLSKQSLHGKETLDNSSLLIKQKAETRLVVKYPTEPEEKAKTTELKKGWK